MGAKKGNKKAKEEFITIGGKMGRYFRLINKVKSDRDVYKVFEKYALSLREIDLKDQKDEMYWTICGEALSKMAEFSFYESKETLLGKKSSNDHWRYGFFSESLNKAEKKDIAEKLPKKCPKCGFHRFWEINVIIWSATSSVWVECPNCGKKVISNEDLEWSDT